MSHTQTLKVVYTSDELNVEKKYGATYIDDFYSYHKYMPGEKFSSNINTTYYSARDLLKRGIYPFTGYIWGKFEEMDDDKHIRTTIYVCDTDPKQFVICPTRSIGRSKCWKDCGIPNEREIYADHVPFWKHIGIESDKLVHLLEDPCLLNMMS